MVLDAGEYNGIAEKKPVICFSKGHFFRAIFAE
jgi:hypothetical protein